MKKTLLLFTCVLGIGLMSVPLNAAPQAKKYQVTGIVLSVDDAKIVVKKGDETWEINRSDKMKINGGEAGDIKPGVKVTIFYSMEAAKVELKGGAAE